MKIMNRMVLQYKLMLENLIKENDIVFVRIRHLITAMKKSKKIIRLDEKHLQVLL